MFDPNDEAARETPAFPEPWDPAYDDAIGPGEQCAPAPAELLAWAVARVPGSGLTTDLAQIDVSQLSADEAVTLAQQAQRLASFAAGVQVQAMAAATAQLVSHWEQSDARAAEERRRVNAERAAQGLAPLSSGASFVPPELSARNELAPALRLAPQTLDLALEHAAELAGPARPLLDAMLAGVITDTHAKAIGRALRLLPAYGDPVLADAYAKQCAEVLAIVIPFASRHTPGESRRRTEELALATDPVGARDRRRRSVEEEHGVFLTPMEAGSCQVTAVMPHAHGAALMSAIDILARDDRFETSDGCITAGQRRVAALVALTLGAPGTVGEVTGPVAEAKIKYDVSVVVPLASVLTSDEDSAQGGRIDDTAVSADVLRELLAESGPTSTLRRLAMDPSGCVVDLGRAKYSPTHLQKVLTQLRDGRCRFPGCRAPAWRCEIDHATSWRDGGRTDRANLGLLCKRHHQAKTHGGWQITASYRDGRCRWKSPLGRVYDHEPPALLPPPPTRVTAVAPPDDGPPF